jgi:hypothetical protein
MVVALWSGRGDDTQGTSLPVMVMLLLVFKLSLLVEVSASSVLKWRVIMLAITGKKV